MKMEHYLVDLVVMKKQTMANSVMMEILQMVMDALQLVDYRNVEMV